MVYAQTVLLGLKEALDTASQLPSSLTVATLELDTAGRHEDVRPPIAECKPVRVERNNNRNTELVGYEHDDAGNEIGAIYETWFTMQVQIDLLTAQASQNNVRTIEEQARNALARYDTRKLDHTLPDPNADGVLDDQSALFVGESSPNHDFTQTPVLRARRFPVEIQFEHRIYQSDYEDLAPVQQVLVPDPDDDPVDTDGDGTITLGADSDTVVSSSS